MYKIIPFLLFAFSFPITTDSLLIQSESIIDLRNLNYNEKVDTLRFIKKQSNKIIIYLSDYKLEAQNITLIGTDSIEVELMDSWWWNKPKQPVLYHTNKSPIESLVKHIDEPSYREMFSIQDIIAIHIIKKNLFIIVGIPAFMLLSVIGLFGM